ncbi:hypothetical protein WI44_11940 [Burkholderia cepacia]|nr:hypothetical protein WI45_36385 [Burkholderia cepacia]KVA37063.1 hypothetical protein WI44_11940 [Burkholderia cepacia]
MHAVLSEPRENLQIKRIAILAFVHHDFVKTCRKCPAQCPAVQRIKNQPQRLNAGIVGAQIAGLQQGPSPMCRCLLISGLMLANMVLQSSVPDPPRINDIGFWVE